VASATASADTAVAKRKSSIVKLPECPVVAIRLTFIFFLQIVRTNLHCQSALWNNLAETLIGMA
jgi:hypothetical protein